ncbi:MAG: class I SAM-dependent methyltransferase, partial [Bdellovibrionota bacterium]
MVSIVSTSLMPISALAGSSALCLEAFGGEPAYMSVNPTARIAGELYPLPNERGASEYGTWLLPQGLRWRDVLRRGSVILDIGGGKGRAMSELAKEMEVHAVVINVQDFSGLHRGTRFKGSLDFRAGWAEAELKKIPTGSVDVVVDVWGGFTYSPNKAEIIQEIYRVLKPGGRAFILLSSKSPAEIVDPGFNYGQPVSLDSYAK